LVKQTQDVSREIRQEKMGCRMVAVEMVRSGPILDIGFFLIELKGFSVKCL
jgi:hypothetical protein